MKYLYPIIPIILLSLNTFGQTSDLKAFGSSGGSSEADGIKVTWTMGESFTSYGAVSQFIYQEGFHQGNFMVIPNSSQAPVETDVAVYPNPVEGILKISFTDGDPSEPRKIEIYNNQGVMIRHMKTSSSVTLVDFSSLPPAPYVIKVFNNHGSYQVYHVIKQ